MTKDDSLVYYKNKNSFNKRLGVGGITIIAAYDTRKTRSRTAPPLYIFYNTLMICIINIV